MQGLAHKILDSSQPEEQDNLETSQGSSWNKFAGGSKSFFIDPDESSESDIDEPKTSKTTNAVTESLNYWRRQRKVLANSRNATGAEQISVTPATLEDESFYCVWLEKKELARLLQEERAAEGIRKWLRFDTIFGIVVLFNGVWLGLQTQEDAFNWHTAWGLSIDVVFAILFLVEWCIRWYYNPRGLEGMLRDGWTLFDFIVVVLSWVDVALEVIFSSVKVNTSTIVALRSIRLLRMAKLVQLVRHLQEIWILVHGLTLSIRVIGWAILTFIAICYIFALLVLSTAHGNPYLDMPEGHALWGSIYRTMLTLAQLATFVDSDKARVLAEDHVSTLMLVIFVAFIVIASFCLLNLITGLILTSTLVIEDEEESFQLCTQRLLEHRALRALRELLVLHFDRGIASGKLPIVTCDELMKLCNSKAPLRKLPVLREEQNRAQVASETFESALQIRVLASDFAEKEEKDATDSATVSTTITQGFKRINSFITGTVSTSETHKSASNFFEAAGVSEDDIRSIFEQTYSALGYDKPLSIDEFIQNCMWLKGKVHCLDVMHLLVGYGSIHERFSALDGTVSTVAAVLCDAEQLVTKELVKYQSKTHRTSEFTHQISTSTVCVGDTSKLEFGGSPSPAHVDLDMHHPVYEEPGNKSGLAATREHAARLAFDQKIAKEKERCWDRFDLVSAMVIFTNMITIGFEVSLGHESERNYTSEKFDGAALAWLVLELAYVILYALELGVRTVWYYQIEVMQDFRVVKGFLPRLLFVMDWPMRLKVAGIFRPLIQTPKTLMLLDLIIVTVGLFDVLVLRLVGESLATLADAATCMALIRLIRSVRLVRLIRPLFSLVKSFLVNISSVLWSFIILATMIYGAAIAMVVLVGFYPEAAENNEEVKHHWDNIPNAMLTLAQMITYENLRERMTELSDFSWFCWAICSILVAISSWAILNLVVGMMVQASFTCVVAENELKLQGKIATIRPDIMKEIQKAHEAIEERVRRRSFWVRDYIQGLRQAVENIKQQENEAAEAAAKENKPYTGEDSDFLADLALHNPWQWSPRNKQAHQVRGHAPRGVTHVTTLQETRGKQNKDTSKESEPAKPCSSHDDDNYCTILSATWISTKDLAIHLQLNQDTSPGPIRDPKKSILIWDSVRVDAGVFLPEMQILTRKAVNVSADFGILDHDFQATEGMENINRVHVSDDRGDLIFFDVPKGARKYRFRFGGNYSIVEIKNFDHPPGLNDMVEAVDFKELILTDRDHLSIREVLQILRSTTMRWKLKEIGLTSENILTVFQKLNVAATGVVSVDDVVDGLLRLRIAQIGADVAGGKSFIRRLIAEVGQLERNALDSAYCCCDIVQSLRGVEIVDEAKPTNVNSCQSRTSSRESTCSSSFVTEVEHNLLQDVQHMERKVQNMRRHFVRYREQNRDLISRNKLDDFPELMDPGMRENTNASKNSITSPAPGWD